MDDRQRIFFPVNIRRRLRKLSISFRHTFDKRRQIRFFQGIVIYCGCNPALDFLEQGFEILCIEIFL